MKRQLNQSGFAVWELVLGVLVVAVIGYAGYHVYTSRQSVASTSSTSTTGTVNNTSATAPTPVAPATIDNTTQLDQASAALNQVDPSGSNASDNNQLSSQSNF